MQLSRLIYYVLVLHWVERTACSTARFPILFLDT